MLLGGWLRLGLLSVAFFLGAYYSADNILDTLPEQQCAPVAVTACPQCTCPAPIICAPEKTCETCTICPPTTTLACPPPPEMVIPEAIQKTHLNMRLAAGKPPAVQHGYYICLQDTWELYDIPGRPRFYPGPANDYYRTLDGEAVDKMENLTCFRTLMDGQGEYILFNRTPDQNSRDRWGWDDNQCLSSALKMRHL